MRRAALLLGLTAATSAALAGAPETSLRPIVRPAGLVLVGAAPETSSPDAPLPASAIAHPSQGTSASKAATPEANAPATVRRGGLRTSLRPLLRSSGITRKAQKQKEALARGSVCGDPAIQGKLIGLVAGRIKGCGIENAVKIRSIGGVALSQHALMDCQTARTLKAWMQEGMESADGGYGGGVAQLHVAAHYACRPRNNQKGAKISEHGKGHAIDIAGFTLRDGRTISVLNDWGDGPKGRILKQMHRSACGRFGTVLGPGANRFHRDHFHFDTARYRKGSYCR